LTGSKLIHLILSTGSPPFSEDEIQGLFQDFQGPFFSIFKDLATGKIFENHLTFILKLKERNAIRKNDIGENEIGENKHLGNNPWAGNNFSIISSLLKINSRTFKDLISFQGLSRPGFFFNKFKDFPGFSRTVGTL
jgi:hypothetical protein